MPEAIKPILMPKWGLAMTEGTLVRWHVPEGADLAEGADLCDIETTKITNVFEMPAAGTVARQLVEPGTVVPVGALIGVLTTGSVSQSEIEDFISGFQASSGAAIGPESEDTGFESQRLADGREIAYRVQGEGSETVLLVHGFAGESGNWTYVQSMLATKRRVVAIDLPGHGRSSKAMGRHPIAGLVAAVTAVARQLDADRLHLVGHSLGGAIAISAAPELPALASLTLIASCGLGAEIDARFIDELIRAERRKDLEPVVARLFADPKLVSRQMINDLLRYKREDGVHNALTTLAAEAFRDGRQALELRPLLLRLSVPVQIIWGGDDQIIPSSHAAGLPDTMRICRLTASGHMPHVEKAAEVAKLIDAITG